MQRNTLFGGLALMAAGGLIGAGAMISSNAMAATDAPPPANELTMINVGPDGEAVKCTFSGAEVEAMLPDQALGSMLPSELPADGAAGGGVFTVSGIAPGDGTPIEIDPNNPPPGVVVGSTGSISISATDDAALPMLDGAPVQVFTDDDARDGTPEECEAMRNSTVVGAVDGSTQMISGSVSLDAGGSATKP